VKRINLPIAPKELTEKDSEQKSLHELIIKFRDIHKELIAEILKGHPFSKIKIVRKDQGEYFAYCQFTGDIKELNNQLKALKTKALLSVGKQEGDKSTILEFFVDFNELSPVIPVLPGPKRKGNKAFIWTATLLGLFLLLLAANKLRPVIEKGLTLSVPKAKITELSPARPAWNMFVLPRYQPGWLEVKKTFELDEITILECFKKIKSTGYEGHSGILNDLTKYPEIIKRALSLIILENVKDTNQLETMVQGLKSKFLRSQPFPDQANRDYAFINALDYGQTENAIVLTFYEHILKDTSFASFCIIKIREGSNLGDR
jgi:hypothetical protein